MGSYYNKEGEQISLAEFCTLIEDRQYVQLKDDTEDDISVSTVWLGLDHGWGDDSPLIFETTIFGGRYSDEQWRYSTMDEALAGHETAKALAFGDSYCAGCLSVIAKPEPSVEVVRDGEITKVYVCRDCAETLLSNFITKAAS